MPLTLRRLRKVFHNGREQNTTGAMQCLQVWWHTIADNAPEPFDRFRPFEAVCLISAYFICRF